MRYFTLPLKSMSVYSAYEYFRLQDVHTHAIYNIVKHFSISYVKQESTATKDKLAKTISVQPILSNMFGLMAVHDMNSQNSKRIEH